MPKLAYFTSKYFKWLKLLVYFKNKNILWWTCVCNRKILVITIEYIICYFCRLEFEPPLSAVAPNPTSFKILHGVLSQKTCMFCIEWTKTLWDCFSTGEERMFRSIKASKTWCTIQAFLVFFYKWTQKHHWSIRAQSLNLSLGTLVLPDVNF